MAQPLPMHSELASYYQINDQQSVASQKTLHSADSPLGDFVRETVLVLLWYGVVAVAGRNVWTSFLTGKPDWNGGALMLLFVVLGLILIKHSVYSFLSLFSPRPTISLENTSICLGDTVTLHWQFFGSIGSLRTVEINLVGQEKTYVQCRGRRRAITETFAHVSIFESTSGLAAGQAHFIVPKNSMHSFEADGNEIVWSVEVSSLVQFWPDVVADFPIVVCPQRKNEQTLC
jgi:hypothetical protein